MSEFETLLHKYVKNGCIIKFVTLIGMEFIENQIIVTYAYHKNNRTDFVNSKPLIMVLS